MRAKEQGPKQASIQDFPFNIRLLSKSRHAIKKEGKMKKRRVLRK